MSKSKEVSILSHQNKKFTPAYHKSYEIIRDKILNGEIPSGTKITEEKLASELGVSRTPIRESIRKLQYEGLIVNKMVINPSEKDLRHMFEVRILLEGHSAKYAASYMPEKELNKLWECVQKGRSDRIEEIMEGNEKFHEIIVEASNNPVMIDIIGRMKSIIYLFRRTVVYYNRPFLIDEHENIYIAIKERDGEKAEQLMKAHLQEDLDFCLHLLRD